MKTQEKISPEFKQEILAFYQSVNFDEEHLAKYKDIENEEITDNKNNSKNQSSKPNRLNAIDAVVGLGVSLEHRDNDSNATMLFKAAVIQDQETFDRLLKSAWPQQEILDIVLGLACSLAGHTRDIDLMKFLIKNN